MFDVSFAVAFTAGIVSFLSPCVLPIIPGYLSYISGVGIEDVAERKRLINLRVFFSALFFVAGFIIIFTLLGASASFIGSFLKNYQREIAQIGGGIVIFFGLHFSGLFSLSFESTPSSLQTGKAGDKNKNIFLGSFLTRYSFCTRLESLYRSRSRFNTALCITERDCYGRSIFTFRLFNRFRYPFPYCRSYTSGMLKLSEVCC